LGKLSCDMHVHSRFSRESGLWILRSLKAPESFTPPELIYELSRRRGMDLVTITDINTIDGCLAISHLPGAFLSEEVRTYLPGRRAVLHLLVYHLDPPQHEEIVRVRDSFPALLEYLRDRKLVHSLAHIFHFPGADLSPEEFAGIIRSVELVEGLNGSRSRLENSAVAPFVRALRASPGFSGFTAGSDDHCGRFMGLTFTEVQDASDLEGFLQGVREGRGIPRGQHGTAVRSAYSVYSIAYSFYRDRLTAQKVPAIATMAADRFFRPSASEVEPTLWHKADFLFHQLLKKARKSGDLDFETIFADQLIEIGRDLNLRSGSPELEAVGIDERTYEILNALSNRLLQHYTSLLVKQVSEGRLLDALEAITALIPVVLLNLPYPITYYNGRKARETVRRMICSLTPAVADSLGSPDRRAWFTDTIDDLNGVSRTIQKYGRLALEKGRELAVVTCQTRPLSFQGWVVNFTPIREFPVPNYSSKLLSVPPFLEMLRFVEEHEFSMIYISTPGPVGFAALGISRLLGIPAAGIYHTDYPRHVNHIAQDGKMGEFAGTAAAWFYNSVDMVLVPSRYYMTDLEGMGIPRSKMRLFPRGTDRSLFSPSFRSPDFFARFGGKKSAVRFLYTGRISREKDLEDLAVAFPEVRARVPEAELYFAGDGPLLGGLVSRLSGKGCHFCGELRGEELSRAYASADIFVFPSTTDTYGNSVLEAQASGLPAIVSDSGGPQEIIVPGKTGLVFRSHVPDSLTEAMVTLALDGSLRMQMGKAAGEITSGRAWELAFDSLWAMGPGSSDGAEGTSGP
jgi:glycosyltransferase involved in cell wall biosynthesis